MKIRHYIIAGVATLVGVGATAYAHLPRDSYYEYYDANGGYQGWKYQSCSGHITGGGIMSGTSTVEHTPCGDEPGTGFPSGGGDGGIDQSCGGEGEEGC